jgi:hypothetical protein
MLSKPKYLSMRRGCVAQAEVPVPVHDEVVKLKMYRSINLREKVMLPKLKYLSQGRGYDAQVELSI